LSHHDKVEFLKAQLTEVFGLMSDEVRKKLKTGEMIFDEEFG
jgi:hypothetical protein